MNAHIELNKQHNGIEISFDSKPSAAIREELKTAGFRWHNTRRVWYAKNTEERAQIAENIMMTSRPALEVTGKISREYGEGRKLREDSAREARQTFEELDIPDARFVDGGGLYDGWEGGNRDKWHSDKELKAHLQDDFKRAGLSATFRFPRCGYLTELLVTLRLSRSVIRSFDEWLARDDNHLSAVNWYDSGDNWGRYGYYDATGKYCEITAADARQLPEKERDELGDRVRRANYEKCIAILQDSSTTYKAAEKVLTDGGLAKLDMARRIVGSYNRDCSNSMIDYFDRAIYDDYVIKFVD